MSSRISLLLKGLGLLDLRRKKNVILCIHFGEMARKVPQRNVSCWRWSVVLLNLCNVVVVHLQKFVVDKLLEAESCDTKSAKWAISDSSNLKWGNKLFISHVFIIPLCSWTARNGIVLPLDQTNAVKLAKMKSHNLPHNRPFLPHNETWKCRIISNFFRTLSEALI